MRKKQRNLADDLKLLEYLVNHEVKQAATEFNTTEPAIRAWLYRLRKRLTKLQTFLNRVRTLQRISPRIRKITVSGAVPKSDEDEDY